MIAFPYSRHYEAYELTSEEAWYQSFDRAIWECRSCSDKASAAQALAFEWARGVSEAQRLGVWNGWKEFKRAIAARWFGEPLRHVFQPGWKVEDVMSYIGCFYGQAVRASLFPPDIACHAPSVRLPAAPDQQKFVLLRMKSELVLEVFPESSTITSICFRRYGDCFGANVIYEAGLGQATYVFESEQGEHTLVSANRCADGHLTWRKIAGRTAATSDISTVKSGLHELIHMHSWYLQAAVFGLCRGMGIDWSSIEGYYDPANDHRVIVVDVDLPFDYLFMDTAPR